MLKLVLAIGLLSAVINCATARDTESWDKKVSGKEHPNIQWFKDAKFGMFIHWALFSQRGGTDVLVKLLVLYDDKNTVIVVDYAGKAGKFDLNAPVMVSVQYATNSL